MPPPRVGITAIPSCFCCDKLRESMHFTFHQILYISLCYRHLRRHIFSSLFTYSLSSKSTQNLSYTHPFNRLLSLLEHLERSRIHFNQNAFSLPLHALARIPLPNPPLCPWHHHAAALPQSRHRHESRLRRASNQQPPIQQIRRHPATPPNRRTAK